MIGMSEAKATFRIMGLHLDPAVVTMRLRMTPTLAHRAGDQNVGSSGRRYADFREGLWAIDSQLSAEVALEGHFGALVELINSRAPEIVHLRALGHRMDVYLSVFELSGDEGFSFSSNLLEPLGRLGIGLTLDLYTAVDEPSGQEPMPQPISSAVPSE